MIRSTLVVGIILVAALSACGTSKVVTRTTASSASPPRVSTPKYGATALVNSIPAGASIRRQPSRPSFSRGRKLAL